VHTHAHEAHDAPSQPHRRLLWALLLTLGFSFIEVVAGWWSGSLALLSDAGHMLTDSLALALAACGSDDSSTSSSADSTSGGEMKDATLVLDFVPGPVHAGIYDAVVNGYYEEEGINLKIIEPTSTADTLKLIDAGKADFGIADGIDVATQIADGRGAKGILALVQRPLGGLITLADSGYQSPADLDGKTVGVTGVPSENLASGRSRNVTVCRSSLTSIVSAKSP